MELVLDTNILISAILKDSHTRHFLLLSKHSFFVPEFILNEISDHLEELEGKTFLLGDELKRILDEVILKANIGIISTDELKEQVLRAKEISPDVDDIPYLALALKLGCAIWSNDRELKEKQSIVIVYNSKEVLNMV